MAQVKFYSKTSLPSGADANGVYFIDGGELYKGTQRFGLGRVTSGTAHPANAARGDIDFLNNVPYVFNGTEWQKLGGDDADIRAVVSSMTSGLAKGGTGSYITGIEQDENGNVTAAVSNFATDVLEAVGNSTASGSSNGVIVSVTTTSGKVTEVSVTAPEAKTWTAINVGDANSYIYNVTQGTDGQVSASAAAFPTLDTGDNDGEVKLGTDAAKVSGWDTVKTDITNLQAVVSYSGTGASVVTATTGNFTNLNVTDTATFSATEVSAGTLTVGGTAVDNVSAASATGSNNGVAVTVSTVGGGVDAVGVAVTGNLATFAGKSVVTTLGTASTASNDNIATEKAVRDALNAFDNAMHFRGVFTSPSACSNPQGGDIIIIGGIPAGETSEYTNGQEWIYNDKASPSADWELIGDQSAVTGGGDEKNDNGITIGVETAPATASATVTLTVDAVEAAADVSVAAKATNVVTANKASVGTGSAAGGYGISGQVVLASDAQPDLTITVTPVSTSAGVATGTNTVVTAGAVADYVTSKVAYVPAQGETVTADTTTLDGAMHAVASAVDALKTKTDKYSAGTSTGSWTATGASQAAISTTVEIDATTMAPSVTMVVNIAELQSALGLKAAAYRDVSTTVSDTTSTALVTEGAVATALAWITE